jgi:hypothetical protein
VCQKGRGLYALFLFGFIIQKGFEAANSKRASDAFAAAGFFVAEREAAGLRRLRDSMREKGIPASVPKRKRALCPLPSAC